MSNLGWYQIITTLSKKVGGPKILIGLVIAGGLAVGTGLGIGGTLLTQKGNKSRKKSKDISYLENGRTFTISAEHKDKNGLDLKVGDKFKVLESDGNSILIEKLDDLNNPYFTSLSILKSISDFK